MNNFIWKCKNGLNVNLTLTPNQEYETDIIINGEKVFYQFIQQSKRISSSVIGLASQIGRLVSQNLYFYSTLDNIKYFLPYTHTNGAVVLLQQLANGNLQLKANGNFSGNYTIEGIIFYTKGS